MRRIPSSNKQTRLAEVFSSGKYAYPPAELRPFCQKIRDFLQQPVKDSASPVRSGNRAATAPYSAALCPSDSRGSSLALHR
ncbi:hypothetical protein ACFW9N_23490 [Streptomyces sp. NPDC059496]|uniref:hypothetical protein n=1 Tax=Streptomyces sp. NPDC059496 TaxID=3346851 RepID=UPI0036CFBB1C